MTKDAGRGEVSPQLEVPGDFREHFEEAMSYRHRCVTLLRRRVDPAEAAHGLTGPLACSGCGARVGDYHDDDCPGNDYRLIAEVNGVPVLVEWPNGDYEAPRGLEGIVAYLEAPGGLHEAMERLAEEK